MQVSNTTAVAMKEVEAHGGAKEGATTQRAARLLTSTARTGPPRGPPESSAFHPGI